MSGAGPLSPPPSGGPLAPSDAPLVELPRRRVWTARALAAAADGVQLFLFPLFGEGFASPADLALDAAMAFALTRLVGFHWYFLPTAGLELVPFADLAPTWTAAALLATRRSAAGRRRIPWEWAIALCALAAVVWWVIYKK